ncbi:immunoglobulin superfamily member isoform X2 [Coregonus clupeaformis]|nr:immunoglobulin superfamily member isoform X2 [Coregonus clupeaformis]
MAVTELSEPGSETENTSLSTDVPNDVPVEEEGLVVEEGVVEEWGLVVQQQPDKEKAMAGDDVVFSCLLSGGDPEGMGVQWVVHGHKERHTILEGNQMSKDAFAGRAFLSGNPTAGDFSMMLRNVSRVDRGIYHCLLTPHNGTTVEGSGTKRSIHEDQGQY